MGNPPATSRTPPATSHQQPAKSNQPLATIHQPPAINRQPLIISHQPPATNHTSHQPPAANYQPPATSHQPPATDHKPLATSHKPPATTTFRLAGQLYGIQLILETTHLASPDLMTSNCKWPLGLFKKLPSGRCAAVWGMRVDHKHNPLIKKHTHTDTHPKKKT